MPRVQSSQRSLLSKKKLAFARKQKTQKYTSEQSGGYDHNVPIRIPIKMRINPYAPSPLPVPAFNPNNNKLNSMVNMLDNNLKMLIYLVDADKLKQVQNIIHSNMDVRKSPCSKRTLYRQASRPHHEFCHHKHLHDMQMLPISPTPTGLSDEHMPKQMKMPFFSVPFGMPPGLPPGLPIHGVPVPHMGMQEEHMPKNMVLPQFIHKHKPKSKKHLIMKREKLVKHERENEHEHEQKHEHEREHEHKHEQKHEHEREHEHEHEQKHEHEREHEHEQKHEHEREHEHEQMHANNSNNIGKVGTF